MANTLNLGTDGNWAVKEGSLLGYNSENDNFKPLPFDFTRNSSATRVNEQGLIETVGANVPRIDFTDGKGSLLLEPTRSNLFPYSEDFSNTDWGKSSTGINKSIGTNGINPNIAISPDGTQNADRVNFILQSDLDAGMFDIFAASENNTYSTSVYLKGEGDNVGKKISIRVKRLSGGTFTSVDTDYILTDKWFRLKIDPLTLPSSAIDGIITISSSEATSCLIFGAQVEQGSYATSYISTSGSVATRNADECNNGGNDQVINSTEGVLYAEIAGLDVDSSSRYINIGDGDINTNAIRLTYHNSNFVFFQKYVNGVRTTNLNTTSIVKTDFNKIAIRYNATQVSVFLNGVNILNNSDTNTIAANTLNVLNFDLGNGIDTFYGNTKDLRVYNTALTDAELINLTK